jgi:hypothetical protein
MFSELFPDGMAIKKGKFETDAEFEARLASTGLRGKQLTLLIPADECDVFAYPDKRFYVLICKNSYSDFLTGIDAQLIPPYGITLFRRDETNGEYQGLKLHSLVAHDIILTSIPKGLLWKDKQEDLEVHFGLPVSTDSEEFRSWLKESKVGMALKVRLSDLKGIKDNSATSQYTHELRLAATIESIPVELLNAWIVKKDTSTGIVQWDILPQQ